MEKEKEEHHTKLLLLVYSWSFDTSSKATKSVFPFPNSLESHVFCLIFWVPMYFIRRCRIIFTIYLCKPRVFLDLSSFLAFIHPAKRLKSKISLSFFPFYTFRSNLFLLFIFLFTSAKFMEQILG